MAELYQHQIDVLQHTAGLKRVAYYLDMGLGKTFVGGEKLKALNGYLNLIICQKSKVDDWVKHFIYVVQGFEVLDLTDKKQYQIFINGGIRQSVRTVGIINYDLIFRRKELSHISIDTIMLDESSLIQNRTAKRSKAILKLDFQNVILLSGTPSSGKYENLWTQIHLLGWDISEELYNKQYVNWTLTADDESGFQHRIVDKSKPYKNVERLKRKLREHGAVFMKTEEAFDLPQQSFVKVKIQTSREYKKFMKNSIVTVGDRELIGDTTLTKLLYARMLCSQFNKYKLQAFEDILHSTNDRLIVFYNFNDELSVLQAVVSECGGWSVSVVNGKTKSLDNYEHDIKSVTFVQYQAGAMGLNLQKANKIIYYSLPLSSELFEQSKKRIHRIGQTRPCFYYMLICNNSIEVNILENLNQYRDYNDKLFEEGVLKNGN